MEHCACQYRHEPDQIGGCVCGCHEAKAIRTMSDKEQSAEEIVKSLQWSIDDDDWRAAGCPQPESLDYAIKAALRKPDSGETYRRLRKALK